VAKEDRNGFEVVYSYKEIVDKILDLREQLLHTRNAIDRIGGVWDDIEEIQRDLKELKKEHVELQEETMELKRNQHVEKHVESGVAQYRRYFWYLFREWGGWIAFILVSAWKILDILFRVYGVYE